MLQRKREYKINCKRQEVLSLTCPSSTRPHKVGARLTGADWTSSGTEELLKQAVAEHGAVVSAVAF